MGAEDQRNEAGEEAAQLSGGKAAPEKLDDARKCLEDLFSQSNFAEDAFIQQHMDAQMYIPICILAAHHNITKLGPASANIETLLAAAQQSDHLDVDVDSMLIRPAMKNKRNTLILHDLPEGVIEEELRGLFADCSELDNLCSVKPDVNHTAFVSFKSDESAQTAALWLRSQKLRGESIKCAVKTENAMRSFFPAAPAASPQLSCGSWGTTGNVSWPSSPWTGPAQPWQAGAGMQGYGGDTWGGAEDGKGEKGAGKGKFHGKHRGKGEGASPQQMAAMPSHAEMMSACGSHGMEGVFSDGAGIADPELDDVEVGYKHDFRRYTRQEIIEICSAMEAVPKPESFAKFEKEDTGSVLMRPHPCKDWAPLPTPMLSFATSMLAGEGRRGGGDGEDEHSDHGGARNRRHSRPTTRKSAGPSGAWGKGGAGGGAAGHAAEGHEGGGGGGGGGWNDSAWDWHGGGSDARGGGGGAGREHRRASSRRREGGGSWGGGDWYGGPSWQPKGAAQAWTERGAAAEAPARGTSGEPGKPTWVEKVKEARGSERGVVPQKWDVKAKPGGEAADHGADDAAAAEPPAAPGEAAPAAEAPAAGAAGGGGAPQTSADDRGAATAPAPAAAAAAPATAAGAPAEAVVETKKPEEAAKVPSAPLTWADKVRQGL